MIPRHVQTQTHSAPPSPPTVICQSPPRWLNLQPDLQKSLFVLLIRMLQQHLPATNTRDAREVSNESR